MYQIILIPVKTSDPKSEQYHIDNITILLLEKTIADYKERYEIEIATIDTMQLLVELLNEENVSNQEKYKSEIKRIKYEYYMKQKHLHRLMEIKDHKIELLE